MWTRFVSVCIFHEDPYPNYLVKEREAEVNKSDVLFGMTLGATAEDEDIQEHGFGTRSVRAGRRVRTTTPFPFRLSDVRPLSHRSSTQQKKCALCAHSTSNPALSSSVSKIVQSLPLRTTFDTHFSSIRTRNPMPAAGAHLRRSSLPW
jgi:hypothetical protein